MVLHRTNVVTNSCLLCDYFVVGSSFDTLAVTWTAPRVTNGEVVSYQLQRDDNTPWSFTPLDDMVSRQT